MTEIAPDKELKLNIKTKYKADIYLSCSWQPGAGQDASWFVVKELDASAIRAVGDVKDFEIQDDNRLRRIMRCCNGFIAILPFRKGKPNLTSLFMIQEICLATELNIPIAIFYELRIPITINQISNDVELCFQQGEKIKISGENYSGSFIFDEGSSDLSTQITGKINTFINNAIQNPPKIQPYAFFITRTGRDFELAREAVKSSIEENAGIPCLWSSSNQYKTNVASVREETRLLIKNAEFVVADFSLAPETSEIESPNRALETGMAIAYRRPIIYVSQEPRRDPFFSIGDFQVEFWKDESDLVAILRTSIFNNGAVLGGTIYNFELSERDREYKVKILPSRFVMDKTKRYIAPNVYPLSTFESWVVALGFGLSSFSISVIVEKMYNFTHTFDFAALLAGIIALVFASDFNKPIRRHLAQYKYLRWLIFIFGMILFFIVLLMTTKPDLINGQP